MVVKGCSSINEKLGSFDVHNDDMVMWKISWLKEFKLKLQMLRCSESPTHKFNINLSSKNLLPFFLSGERFSGNKNVQFRSMLSIRL